MLMMKERRPAFRTIEGWVRSILIEADAIRECEEHGWMRDRADPHARVRALELAREHPPPGISPDEATATEATRTVMTTGRRRVSAPTMMAFCFDTPSWISCLMKLKITTPF